MHCLILLSSSFIGGAEKNLAKLACKLPEEFTLATTKPPGPITQYASSLGIQLVHCCTKPGFFQSIFAYFNLYFLIIQNRFELVYSIGILNSIILKFLKLFYRFTLVVGVRSNYSTNTLNHRTFNTLEKFTWPMADHYISNSIASARTLASRCCIPASMVTVIHNCLTATEARQVTSHSTKKISIVANISPRKGHIEFLSTIAKLIHNDNNLHFFFIGKDYMNGEVQSKCSQMNLDKHVTFTGYVSDVFEFLSESCVFVLPAKWGEGCPTSILEAMSCALPVVAYSVDGIPELVSDSNLPFLENPSNADLSRSILELLADPSLSRKIGTANFSHLKAKFADDSFLRNHLKIFKSLN